MSGSTLVAQRPAPAALPTASPGSGRPVTRRLRALSTDRWSLILALAVTALVFAVSWYRHSSFRSTTLDLAVFDQAIWKMAHFKAPQVSTIGWNAFADHLSPVLVLFVPLYWLAATPAWLFAAQAVAVGAGYLALRPALEAAGLPRRFHAPLLIAYVASPLLWNALAFDFHPTTMAVPFLLVGLRAALVNDRRGLIISSLCLLALRDDLGLAVAALALWGITRPEARASRRFRLLLGAAALAWMVFGGALGSALGSDRHWDWHYGYLASSPAAALLHPVKSAVALLSSVWRGDNLLLAAGFLVPLGLLPLLSPARLATVLIVALPLLTSAAPHFHSPKFHYGAVPFPFLLLAAAVGLQRLPERWRQPHVALWVTTMSASCLFFFGPPATGELSNHALQAEKARQAVTLVHPGEAVVATNTFGPHLAHRDVLLMFPYPFADGHPRLPLTEAAREVSAEAASKIDVVLVFTAVGDRYAEAMHEDFLASPFLEDFRYVRHFGEATVYRRSAP